MKLKKVLKTLFNLFLAVQMVSCASYTMITSNPQGAKVYLDGMYVGKTPYTHSDTKIVGATTQIKLTKEGCEPLTTFMSRDEKFEIGPCIGGALVAVPFLWIMGYHPTRGYELHCKTTSDNVNDKIGPLLVNAQE